jgi:anti-sigma B factor antagonist
LTITGPAPASSGDLQVSVRRPNTRSVVIEISGALDLVSAPRLAELLTCRLRSAVTRMVIDLSEVSFVSSAGVRVLARAQLLARQLGVNLSIDAGVPRPATRALDIAGLGNRVSAAV